MRLTLNLPDALIGEAQRFTGESVKSRAVIAVLEDYVQRKRMEELLALRGKIVIDYDWEREEEAELEAAQGVMAP